ncbi:MAG: ribbon-helix-helix domain-containing protein [Deltaproteobacteria bacterium]|nr:ribbon-helix-helix domain-containing protein [Deltaproteobacteria bacterium]
MRDTVEVTRRATLLRLPEPDLMSLRALAQRTRISQSHYLREAIGDLLEKYERFFVCDAPEPSGGR